LSSIIYSKKGLLLQNGESDTLKGCPLVSEMIRDSMQISSLVLVVVAESIVNRPAPEGIESSSNAKPRTVWLDVLTINPFASAEPPPAPSGRVGRKPWNRPGHRLLGHRPGSP